MTFSNKLSMHLLFRLLLTERNSISADAPTNINKTTGAWFYEYFWLFFQHHAQNAMLRFHKAECYNNNFSPWPTVVKFEFLHRINMWLFCNNLDEILYILDAIRLLYILNDFTNVIVQLEYQDTLDIILRNFWKLDLRYVNNVFCYFYVLRKFTIEIITCSIR